MRKKQARKKPDSHPSYTNQAYQQPETTRNSKSLLPFSGGADFFYHPNSDNAPQVILMNAVRHINEHSCRSENVICCPGLRLYPLSKASGIARYAACTNVIPKLF